MIIYIVFISPVVQGYNDKLLGIFSSKEKAEYFIKENFDSSFKDIWIEEYELDNIDGY